MPCHRAKRQNFMDEKKDIQQGLEPVHILLVVEQMVEDSQGKKGLKQREGLDRH